MLSIDLPGLPHKNRFNHRKIKVDAVISQALSTFRSHSFDILEPPDWAEPHVGGANIIPSFDGLTFIIPTYLGLSARALDA